MRLQGLRSELFAPLTTPLFAKSYTEYTESIFSLTSTFCDWANFNRLMHMQVQPL